MTRAEAQEVAFTSTLDISKENVPQVPPEPELANPPGCLVLIYPDTLAIGSRYALEDDELSVGRDPENDITIPLNVISRVHAAFMRNGQSIAVQDRDSTNGVYVNGERIKDERLLRHGDLVGIGSAIFKLLMGSSIELAYHEAIYRLTIMDGLTGAYNRRYLMEFLERNLARCRRRAQPLSVIMFDLDHFKKINDGHGHLVGDMVLRDMAARMMKRIRKEEILVRYGGEEFAVALPQTDHRGAMVLAEQIRKIIDAEPFDYDDESIQLTISAGVATTHDSSVEPKDLIKRSDAHLYEAKRRGRNRVIGSRGG